jgi:hypothetical protein
MYCQCGYHFSYKKMRSVSHPGTHHMMFQLNLRYRAQIQVLLARWTNHSILKLCTGFAIAALTAW